MSQTDARNDIAGALATGRPIQEQSLVLLADSAERVPGQVVIDAQAAGLVLATSRYSYPIFADLVAAIRVSQGA